jgi:3-oxoacyl-[acyl-carrier protein] reductase
MTPSFTGKVAIVTGGAKGIGRATAERLLAGGAAVVVWDRDGDALARWRNAPGLPDDRFPDDRMAADQVDVADRVAVDAAVARVLDRFGGVDILINNAGIVRDAQLVKIVDGQPVGRLAEDEFDAVIAVNLTGVFHCTQAVVPSMIARGGGVICNASSVVARAGNFGQTSYVAAKAGVEGMTRVWARELGRHGIRVNAVAPGFIATDMTAAMPPHLLARLAERAPLGRMGTADEVAAAYCFLASDAARFITGAVLPVDGGLVVGT